LKLYAEPVGSAARRRERLVEMRRGNCIRTGLPTPIVGYSLNADVRRSYAMVESRMGAVAWGLRPTLRFPSPLIKPSVPISGTRLSDWLHHKTHDGRPLYAGV